MKKDKIFHIGVLMAVLLSIFGGCRVQYVPIETGTTVHVKDSTVYNYIDSIRIHEATRYKDMAWLGDTLKIDGQRSHMWAFADTSKEAIIGGLEEDKSEEHTKIIYKDKIEYRDSLVYKEIPVEVVKEKIVKHVPWYSKILSVFGLIFLILAGWKIYKKFKGLPIGR